MFPCVFLCVFLCIFCICLFIFFPAVQTIACPNIQFPLIKWWIKLYGLVWKQVLYPKKNHGSKISKHSFQHFPTLKLCFLRYPLKQKPIVGHLPERLSYNAAGSGISRSAGRTGSSAPGTTVSRRWGCQQLLPHPAENLPDLDHDLLGFDGIVMNYFHPFQIPTNTFWWD